MTAGPQRIDTTDFAKEDARYIPFVCEIDQGKGRIVEYRVATNIPAYDDRELAWSDAKASPQNGDVTDPRIATIVDGKIVAVGIGGNPYTETSGEENLTEIAAALGYPLDESIKPPGISVETARATLAYLVEYCRIHQSASEFTWHCPSRKIGEKGIDWMLCFDVNPQDVVDIIFGAIAAGEQQH